jgi:hypothetical protein
MELVLATLDATRDQASALENREMLRDLRWRLSQWLREGRDRLISAVPEPRKDSSAGPVAQREEHLVELCVALALWAPPSRGRAFGRTAAR